MGKPSLLDMYGRPLQRQPTAKIMPKILNSGYSHSAASLTKPAFKGWAWNGGSPDDDIVTNLPIIRQRSRQLTMDAPVIAGLYKTLTTNCVGEGLRPEPTPDAGYLKMSPEEVKSWKASVLLYWEMFAETPNCDVYRRDNFYELTRLVSRAQDESGDVFVTMPMFSRRNVSFDLKLQVVEADCVADPTGWESVKSWERGNDIYGGVEISEYGHILAYWFYTGHPLAQRIHPRLKGDLSARDHWVRIPAYGEETGRQNVLHLMESLRPGQRRGLPLITSVVELALTLDRYMKAEAVAAQIQALFTLIVTSENPEAAAGEMEALMGDEEISGDDSLIALGNGIVQYARPGEKVEPVNPTRPTSVFQAFVTSLQEMMGPSVGMPYELLVQRFNASYSASRAAMNMASTGFKVKRAALIHDYCQPVYEAFMDEAVSKGWVNAPGYWDNPIIRRAYTRARWNGPAMPQIDLLKEVQAAELRVKYAISTLSEVTRELTGGDWNENVAERGREIEALRNAGLELSLQPTQTTGGDAVADQSETEILGGR